MMKQVSRFHQNQVMRFTPEPNSNMPSITSKLMPKKGLAPTLPS